VKTLKAAGYKPPFFDVRETPGAFAVKLMAEQTTDGRRGITCVVSYVDYWSYTLIWFPGTAEQRFSGRLSTTAEFGAMLKAAWKAFE
jgi:hypothetical protein